MELVSYLAVWSVELFLFFLVWVDSFPVIHEYLRFVRLFKWDHMSAKPVKEGRINMVIVALNAFIHYYFANLLHFRVFWFFNSLIVMSVSWLCWYHHHKSTHYIFLLFRHSSTRGFCLTITEKFVVLLMRPCLALSQQSSMSISLHLAEVDLVYAVYIWCGTLLVFFQLEKILYPSRT